MRGLTVWRKIGPVTPYYSGETKPSHATTWIKELQLNHNQDSGPAVLERSEFPRFAGQRHATVLLQNTEVKGAEFRIQGSGFTVEGFWSRFLNFGVEVLHDSRGASAHSSSSSLYLRLIDFCITQHLPRDQKQRRRRGTTGVPRS